MYFQIVVLTKQTFATSCEQQTTSGLPSNNNISVSNTHLLHLRAVEDNFRQHLQAFYRMHTMMTSRTRRRSTSHNSTHVTRTELDHLTQCCDIYITNNNNYNNNNNNRLSISTNHNQCQYLPFEPTHLTTKNLHNNHPLHTSHFNHIHTQPMT